MYVLRIKILDTCPNIEQVRDYYQNIVDKTSYLGDCGVDLIFPDTVEFTSGSVTKCGLGIACEMIKENSEGSEPFTLTARSSIANTPLILANGIGIIDPGYRGEIIAALRCYYDRDHPTTFNDGSYKVSFGQRLVQIISPTMKPIRVVIVDELSDTERGSKGFGSTNNIVSK